MSELTTWIEERSEGMPAALQPALHAGIADVRSTGDVAAGLIDGAAVLLERVLSSMPMRRDQALDLLAADALATMACEAAADDPATFEMHARHAMKTIGSMGRPHDGKARD
jgi:hypothetical protein